MQILKQIFLFLIVLTVIQQCEAMNVVRGVRASASKAGFRKAFKKRFYSRANFKNWFNRFKKPQLSKTQKAVGLTTEGVTAAATYTWWDKIKDFFGYGRIDSNSYEIEQSRYYNGTELESIRYTFFDSKISKEELEADLKNMRIYNTSKAKNGCIFELLKGDSITSDEKIYNPVAVVLKDPKGNIKALYVFRYYPDYFFNIEPEHAWGLKPDTAYLIASSVIRDNYLINKDIDAQYALLGYAEEELKSCFDIKTIFVKTKDKKTSDLLKIWGYENGTKELSSLSK